jgi:hypothetical protein
MESVGSLGLAIFGALAPIVLLAGAAIDMAARIEYAQEIFPFLKRVTEHGKWRGILLLATFVFYGGTLYELLKSPALYFPPEPNPGIPGASEIVEENRDLKAERRNAHKTGAARFSSPPHCKTGR